MKIVRVSNFGNESISDMLIAENVDNHYGEEIVRSLNNVGGNYDPYYFRLVHDDYKLYKFEP